MTSGNTSRRPKWYEASYRRHLIDMHIPDWDERFLSRLDPEQYVKLLRTAQVDTAMVYSSSCLGICYWPTQVGYMHTGIQGRDVLGEIIHGSHEAGLNVIVYFNFWTKWAAEQHPDWRIIAADGRGTWSISGPLGITECVAPTPHTAISSLLSWKIYVSATISRACGSI